jgi:hypothetical protein
VGYTLAVLVEEDEVAGPLLSEEEWSSSPLGGVAGESYSNSTFTASAIT